MTDDEKRGLPLSIADRVMIVLLVALFLAFCAVPIALPLWLAFR